ncbi:interleukin-15 receptor subunit alpha isoform X2 [Pagrus major]|uniref:interleukin-15 receptor subunit alpha isoform X2 n=1 Tax=Pagrus major TaxID=143350 RepID=UPI003CC8CD81
MDLGSLLFSVCLMMISVPGDVRCSAGDATNCTCPPIPPKSLTQPLPETCFQVNNSFRYSCIGGYVRKAGTSALTRCKNIDGVTKWMDVTLQCIPDPKIIPPPPPPPTVEQVHTDIPLDSTIATIATTVTATASLQTTQSISTSVSVTAETDSTEPTSPGLQDLSVHTPASTVDVTDTQSTARTTPVSTTAVPSENSTVGSHALAEQTSTTIAKIAIVSLVTICAVAGISFYFYKRRTKYNIPVRTTEDDMDMDDIQSSRRVCSQQPDAAAEGSRLNGDQDWKV